MILKRHKKECYLTLNGPLSVLKLIPGMYLSQTGNPLKNE